MSPSNAAAGTFRCGLPYNRFGHGPRPLIVFQGLAFENKPMPHALARRTSGLAFLEDAYTIFIVVRKPGLPAGYSLKQMGDDYAALIREEFGGPVDIIGTSTGGSIAQVFAADYPDLVRKLVLHSSAHTVSEAAKAVQMQVRDLAAQRRYRRMLIALMDFILPSRGIKAVVNRAGLRVGALLMVLTGYMVPEDPSDLIVTIEAEDRHAAQDRLAAIRAPTLVIAGAEDPFHSEALFRETAAGIPNATLILYPGMGHPAAGEQFRRDVRAFLTEA